MIKAPKAKLPSSRGGLPRLAFTTKETAKILGIGETSVYRLVQRGKLFCSPHLRHKIIPLTSIEEFLNSRAA
jgi:excisionase family DNA binding protein